MPDNKSESPTPLPRNADLGSWWTNPPKVTVLPKPTCKAKLVNVLRFIGLCIIPGALVLVAAELFGFAGAILASVLVVALISRFYADLNPSPPRPWAD